MMAMRGVGSCNSGIGKVWVMMMRMMCEGCVFSTPSYFATDVGVGEESGVR